MHQTSFVNGNPHISTIFRLVPVPLAWPTSSRHLTSQIPTAHSYVTPHSTSISQLQSTLIPLFEDSTLRKSKLAYQALVTGSSGMHFRLPTAVSSTSLAIGIGVEKPNPSLWIEFLLNRRIY